MLSFDARPRRIEIMTSDLDLSLPVVDQDSFFFKLIIDVFFVIRRIFSCNNLQLGHFVDFFPFFLLFVFVRIHELFPVFWIHIYGNVLHLRSRFLPATFFPLKLAEIKLQH